MRIALVSKNFPPAIRGGGEISACYLAHALSRFAEVHVITSQGMKEIKGLWLHPVIKNRNLSGILNYISRNELFYYHTYKSLKKLFTDHRFDVVHALNMDTIPGTAIAATKHRIPFVFTVNSQWLTCPHGFMLKLKDSSICKGNCNFLNAAKCYYHTRGPEKILGPLYYPLQMYERKKTAQKASAIICISENIKNYIASLDRKTVVIPNIVPPQNRNPREEFKTDLLFVGALGRYKGCEYLIQAMKTITRNHPDCKLRIVGSGPKEREFQMLTKSLGLSRNIFFEGFVSHSQILDYYASTKIVVFPSVVPETFGRIAAEAMAAGKPVIATRVGGIPELVKHGETGILVSPKNPEEIAEAAIYLLENQDKAVEMGRKGKKLIEEKCSPQVVAKKHLKLYREVIERC